MTTIDGGNRWQNATQLKTFRRLGSFSFGDNFFAGERAEWFKFRTTGRSFDRAAFFFAAAVQNQAKFDVFFRPEDQNRGTGKRIGGLTLTPNEPDGFISKNRGSGTYFIKATLQSVTPTAYGVSFSFVRSRSQQVASAPHNRSGQDLFS